MKSGTELQESNGNWSGTIVVTSEDDLMEFSTQTGGSIPRLLRLNGITWTKDASHSKRIKRFIMSHHGFIGREFVEHYTQLDYEDIITMYEAHELAIDERLKSRDQYTARIVSKLAIIAMTAELIERFFDFEHYSAAEIVDTIVDHENMTAVGRSMELLALDIIKDYIVKNQFTLARKTKLQGSRSEVIESKSISSFNGYLHFKNAKVVEVTLLSRVVREELESHDIYQWNTVLKRWKDIPFIKKYGKDGKVSETDNLLKVKAITFVFDRDDDSLLN